MIDHSPVPCPHCHHDLRGVPVESGLYRCPECGQLTNLDRIVRAKSMRARSWQRLIGSFLIFAIVMTIVMGIETLDKNAENDRGWPLALLLAPMFLCGILLRGLWPQDPLWVHLIFSIGFALGFLLPFWAGVAFFGILSGGYFLRESIFPALKRHFHEDHKP